MFHANFALLMIQIRRTKHLNRVWRVLIVILSVLFLLLLALIAPIDDDPPVKRLKLGDKQPTLSIPPMNFSVGSGQMDAGWSTVNITPPAPLNLAGYGLRGRYSDVLDSLYARVVVLDNGEKEVVIISVDLIMFPRILKVRIEAEEGVTGLSGNDIYYSATHTHHGFGNWEQSLAGNIIFGKFDEHNLIRLTNLILQAIKEARLKKAPVKMAFSQTDASELIKNRLDPKNGIADPFIRTILLENNHGIKAMILSFAGHATTLDSDTRQLSRDYPGILSDELEKGDSIDFAMFCAGMVGSHNMDIDIPKSQEKMLAAGIRLAEKIEGIEAPTYFSNSVIGSANIEIPLPPSQMRITKHLRIRDWVFSALFGKLKANVKVMRIGDVLLLGMPCDFSGAINAREQLGAYAESKGLHLFISSFNGNYIGYITEDQYYYAINHEEVRIMNWLGPYMGEYFSDYIKIIIDAAAQIHTPEN